MYSYYIAGLSVCSEIAFPGAIAALDSCAHPEVTIRQGAVPERLEKTEMSGPTWEIGGGCFLLCIPNVARFLITRGHEITFEVEKGTPTEDVAVFLAGSVFGILMHQRERIILHASAVRVNGSAVLFCGPSGAGKSTIAAALSKRGYSPVADDLCAIAMGETPKIYPQGHRLKLWAEAIDALDLAAQRREPVRSRLQKFYVTPSEGARAPIPFGAAYALREARPPHAAGIERANAVDAAIILQRSAYRPLLVSRLGQRVLYFRAAVTMANAAGVFTLTRPLDFEATQEVLSWLERHWSEIGLTECAA